MIRSMERGADPVHDRVALTPDELQAIARLDAQYGGRRRPSERVLRWSWLLLVVGTVGVIAAIPTSFVLAIVASAVWTIGLAGAIADVRRRIAARRGRRRDAV